VQEKRKVNGELYSAMCVDALEIGSAKRQTHKLCEFTPKSRIGKLSEGEIASRTKLLLPVESRQEYMTFHEH
jgi:hypothetical protein